MRYRNPLLTVDIDTEDKTHERRPTLLATMHILIKLRMYAINSNV